MSSHLQGYSLLKCQSDNRSLIQVRSAMYTISQEKITTQEPGGTPMPARVLVVDDERVVTEVVERYLQREGYEVSLASDGAEALRLAQEWAPDLVVLDLMLPTIDGLEVCRQLRRDSPTPIIMLTARGEETDRVVGLELGADDYISKPFSPREVVARVRAVLRRAARDDALDGDPSTVTVHIRRLREKIEPDPSSPRRLVTVWGAGYRFEP